MERTGISMRSVAFALVSITAALALGCAQPEPGRVLAKVNGAEISAREATTRQALDRIIDRELLVQKALAAGLDRDPRSCRQSTTPAASSLPRPGWSAWRPAAKATPEEVRAFYGENPALFGERRIYRLLELTVSAPAEMLDVLRAEARTAQGPGRGGGLAAPAQREVRRRPASRSPPSSCRSATCRSSARMKQGEIAVFASPLGASVVQLVHRAGRAARRARGGAGDRAVPGGAQAPGARRGRGEAAARRRQGSNT